MTGSELRSVSDQPSVKVAVRADLALLHIFRGVSEMISHAADFDLDASEDLRLAVDEVAATLIGISDSDADVLCEFSEHSAGGLRVTMTAERAVARLPKSNNFRWHIVRTLTDELSWDEDVRPPHTDSAADSYSKTVVQMVKRKASSPRG
ncbi:hypothetical protein IEU95_08850 [Hoyosella rhizosphaerae]|uniref:Anti-sigma factor n=1 Tax=Hoyosella rhizosphaerae TaxID=1755582 RepID=A0A916U1B2_9ACTN|nr:hypothetical protein [Hoyosella rhizosphaerae]MBN4926938.1 hypothetical protein [Hoyosella rhizosphaerae]GGC55337.1 hypothetical protein GCM10011410_04650 [Hoyosella rhizosphaerae]